tara:strand:- start:11 stop:349 length:339 start_codon:yes stop_codon:yes gene_type:complete
MCPSLIRCETSSALGGVAAVLDSSVSCGSVETHRNASDRVNYASKSVKVNFDEVLKPDIQVIFDGFYESRRSCLWRRIEVVCTVDLGNGVSARDGHKEISWNRYHGCRAILA